MSSVGAKALDRPKGMYEFGQNWADFAKNIEAENLIEAEAGLTRLLEGADITDQSFLDIGCGSGVHALAALKKGAGHVHAIDIDENSVETCRAVLAEHWQKDKNYYIEQQNILHGGAIKAGPFDVVYSWGVLHHTGDMWTAIENAASYVADGRLFIIAIYKKTPVCSAWKVEKHLYSALPKLLRYPLDWLYGLAQILGLLARGRNPVKYIRNYKSARGMSWMTDIRDWLGGYPYESASPEEIKSFVEARGFQMIKEFNVAPSPAFGLLGTGCAEYVFKKVEK